MFNRKKYISWPNVAALACVLPFFMALAPTSLAAEEACACAPETCLQFDRPVEISGVLSSRRLRYTDDDGYDYRSYFLTFDAPRCIALAGSDHGFLTDKIQVAPNADHFAKNDLRDFEGSHVRLTGGLISAYREDHVTPTLLIADDIK